MTWRTSTVMAYGWRSLTADAWRVSIVAAVVGLGTFGAASSELIGRTKAHEDLAVRLSAGGTILVASSESLDAGRCEMLGTQVGILRSGGLREGPIMRWRGDAATPIPTGSMTAGFVSVLRLNDEGGSKGWFVGEYLANTLGLSAGDRFGFAGSAAVERIDVVVPQTPRSSPVAGWALALSPPTGSITQCWVEAESIDTEAAESALRAALAGGGDFEIRALSGESRELVDAYQRTQEHPGRSIGVLSVVVVGLFSLVVTRFRRTEFALCRSVGMRRRDLFLVTSIEAIVISIVAALYGSSLALLESTWWLSRAETSRLPQTLSSGLLYASLSPLTAIIVLPLGPVLSRVDILDALKDR